MGEESFHGYTVIKHLLLLLLKLSLLLLLLLYFVHVLMVLPDQN